MMVPEARPGQRTRPLKLLATCIMTSPVITARPDATIRDLAALMTAHRISGIPIVTAEHELVGIVTEGDLLYKEVRPRPSEPAALEQRLPIRAILEAADRARKAEGVLARDLMTSPVLTVTEAAPLHEIAALMVREGINRVPVLRAGRVAVEVRDGVVYLDGRVERRSERELAERWAAMADGVVDVQSRLAFELDDARIRPEQPRR